MTRQLYLDGTAPPHNPDIEAAIDAWHDAQEAQKSSAERTKIRHASLLEQMARVQCEAYPYTDRTTGKRKILMVVREPKAKASAAGEQSKSDRETDRKLERREERKAEAKAAKADAKRAQLEAIDVGEEVVIDDGNVEVRRVKRASIEAEIDPFAATRANMNGGTPKTVEVVLLDDVTPKPKTKPAKSKAKPTGKRKAARPS